jgi:hypothetical protein
MIDRAVRRLSARPARARRVNWVAPYQITNFLFMRTVRYGRGAGVGLDRGTGVDLGVVVAVGVGVPLAVAVGVAVGVGLCAAAQYLPPVLK